MLLLNILEANIGKRRRGLFDGLSRSLLSATGTTAAVPRSHQLSPPQPGGTEPQPATSGTPDGTPATDPKQGADSHLLENWEC